MVDSEKTKQPTVEMESSHPLSGKPYSMGLGNTSRPLHDDMWVDLPAHWPILERGLIMERKYKSVDCP
jgi:hypothetical protein